MRMVSVAVVLFTLVPAACALAEEAEHPLEPALTTSPRATLTTFLETFRKAYDFAAQQDMRRGMMSSSQRLYYRSRIAGCLDLSEVPPALQRMQSDEAATCLKEVLDRIELPPESEWPDEAKVAEEEIDRWTLPHTEITIARVEQGPKKGQYLFTPDTIDGAADFYDRVRHLPYQDRATSTPGIVQFYQAEPGTMISCDWIKSLPAWAHRRPGGQAVWQWIGLACVLLVSLLLMLAAYLIGMRSSQLARNAGLVRYLMTIAFPIIAMAVPLVARYFIKDQLRITGNLLVGLLYFLSVVLLFALIMFVLGSGNRVAAIIIATPWIKPGGMDAQFVRLTCRVLSIVAAVVILLEGGQQIGIPLTTLLAGAGVGGLALA